MTKPKPPGRAIPILSEQAYAAILMNNPTEHAEEFGAWQKRIESEGRQSMRVGGRIVEVVVDPQEFATVIRALGLAPKTDLIEFYARIVAERDFPDFDFS